MVRSVAFPSALWKSNLSRDTSEDMSTVQRVALFCSRLGFLFGTGPYKITSSKSGSLTIFQRNIQHFALYEDK